MKKLKRLGAIASILVILLMMYPSSYNSVIAAETRLNVQTENNNQDVRLKDDFYDAINEEWLNTAKVEDGKSTNSTFDDVEEKVTNQTKDIINQLLIHKDKYKENSDEKKIINVYNNTLNVEARNKDGLKPVQSPNKFRVNAVLPQFQEFYDTYGIVEKDGMYVKPEDRLGIW